MFATRQRWSSSRHCFAHVGLHGQTRQCGTGSGYVDAGSLPTTEERNDLVHSMWSFGPNFDRDNGTSLKVEKNGGVAKLEIKPRTLADLKDLVARMEANVDMLTYLHPKAR
jgi:hypothetical protein